MNLRPVIALLFITANALAADPAPPAKYELKNRSAFKAADTARPPFWPVGWQKQARDTGPVAAPVPQGAEPKVEMFTLTSISLGNPSLAVINGRIYGEGDIIKLPKGSAPLRIIVNRIADGTVVLQYLQKTLTIPLRRATLQPAGGEKGVLNEDKDK